MESYRKVVRDIERERENFLEKIDLVQPSFQEQHQLEWNSRYQEEEITALRSEVDRVSQEVEAETKQLLERENVIREIREEQRQDRIKIQTLLALSQPVTPDLTVVFGSFGPRGADSVPSSRDTRRAQHMRQEMVTQAVHASDGDLRGRRAGGSGNKGDIEGVGDEWERSARGDGAYRGGNTVNSNGDEGSGQIQRVPPGDVRDGHGFGNDALDGSTLAEGKGDTEQEFHGGRRGYRMPPPRLGEKNHVRGSDRRSRSSREEAHESGRRGIADKDSINLRCTRGYKEYLERRLELTQRYLTELHNFRHDYEHTLEMDKHERKMRVRVQRENVAHVADSLRRRTVDVEGRLVQATEDYLRLRHKAKEAHSASVEEQRDHAKARQKSEAQVKSRLAASKAEMEQIRREGKDRLEDSTFELREMVLAAERALQEERFYQAEIKQCYEDRIAYAHEAVLSLRRRHSKLVDRRAKEVIHLNAEMLALRRGVAELERRMFAAW